MPAYSEPEMLARAAGLLAPSLPRVVPRPPVPDKPLAENSRHEVVVIGTGPAGMFTAYLLARFGVSALAVDLVNTPLIPGHADGLQPRTLEVMQTLGLANQILSQCKVSVKCAFWNPAPDGSRHIERTTEVNDVDVATRYPFKVLLAAERVVNIIEKDMTRYGGKAERGVEFVDFELSDNDPEWPVRVHLRDVTTGREFSVVSKYLIGADGAHSRVREKMGVKLHGDSNNSIWGVVDAVVKTDFPDIRKRCAIVREPSSPSQGPLLSLSMWQHSDAGSLMIIPREKIENGQYMTRFYTQLGKAEDSSDPTLRDRFKTQRVQMTLPVIMDQVKKVIAPYKLEVGYTDWWAAYVIGQRVAERFSLKDKKGRERVFIIGDACHTHSPKAGQGMNVSMMDAYNLAWKIAHTVGGLAGNHSVLETFETERRLVANQLIEFDHAFATKFCQTMAPEAGGLTHEDFFGVFASGRAFTSGCAVEYQESCLVNTKCQENLISAGDPDMGRLTPGRRLMNKHLKRFCDDVPVELQDELPINAAYAVLLFAPNSVKSSTCQEHIAYLARDLPGQFPPGLVIPIVVHAYQYDELEWNDFPKVLREKWEWNLFRDPDAQLDATLGINYNTGAIVVVRPDGVIGGVWGVEQLVLNGSVHKYLSGCLLEPTRE